MINATDFAKRLLASTKNEIEPLSDEDLDAVTGGCGGGTMPAGGGGCTPPFFDAPPYWDSSPFYDAPPKPPIIA